MQLKQDITKGKGESEDRNGVKLADHLGAERLKERSNKSRKDGRMQEET